MAIARKFGRDVYKWHVPDLLEAASGLEVFETGVERFNLDVDAWFGEACSPTISNVVAHAKRILSCDMSEPIVLSAEGHVFDGLHRLARCRLDGIDLVRCKQFERNPEPFEIVSFVDFRKERPLIAETLLWMEKNGL